jgi:hypothetical protein
MLVVFHCSRVSAVTGRSGVAAGDDSDRAPIEPIHGPGLTMQELGVHSPSPQSLGPFEQPDVGEAW